MLSSLTQGSQTWPNSIMDYTHWWLLPRPLQGQAWRSGIVACVRPEQSCRWNKFEQCCPPTAALQVQGTDHHSLGAERGSWAAKSFPWALWLISISPGIHFLALWGLLWFQLYEKCKLCPFPLYLLLLNSRIMSLFTQHERQLENECAYFSPSLIIGENVKYPQSYTLSLSTLSVLPEWS